MASYHNISGESTQQLLAAGSNVSVTSISLTNVHADTPCTVNLYIEKTGVGSFHVIKSTLLPIGATLVLEGNDIKFSNKTNQFSLFIKLTKSASETPAVDVIIN